MADLDAAIRAKLADRPALEASELPGERSRDVNGWISAARSAIEAVLDEHQPESNEAWTSSTPSIVCSCSPGEDDHYDVPYPCPTKRAIAEKLGVGVDGG